MQTNNSWDLKKQTHTQFKTLTLSR